MGQLYVKIIYQVVEKLFRGLKIVIPAEAGIFNNLLWPITYNLLPCFMDYSRAADLVILLHFAWIGFLILGFPSCCILILSTGGYFMPPPSD